MTDRIIECEDEEPTVIRFFAGTTTSPATNGELEITVSLFTHNLTHYHILVSQDDVVTTADEGLELLRKRVAWLRGLDIDMKEKDV